MGCSTDLLKLAVYGGLSGYSFYKAATWNNGFWRIIAGALGAFTGVQAVREGFDASSTCKGEFGKLKR